MSDFSQLKIFVENSNKSTNTYRRRYNQEQYEQRIFGYSAKQNKKL